MTLELINEQEQQVQSKGKKRVFKKQTCTKCDAENWCISISKDYVCQECKQQKLIDEIAEKKEEYTNIYMVRY